MKMGRVVIVKAHPNDDAKKRIISGIYNLSVLDDSNIMYVHYNRKTGQILPSFKATLLMPLRGKRPTY